MMQRLESIVDHARRFSPYYAHHLRALPARGWSLSDLPLIEAASFWRMERGLAHWPVLTGALEDAVVFKTGGTAGPGKLSVFSREEWQGFVSAFGRGMASRLRAGDRVANLFFAGDLYASFLFIHGALQSSPVPVTEYPFAGLIEPGALAQSVESFGISVLAGLPVQMLRLAEWLEANGRTLPQVTTLLYGGEGLFAEQTVHLARVFPNAHCASIGYAGVDSGLLGASTADCRFGEHRVFDDEACVELIDEDSGEVIETPGRAGRLVVTSLTRYLMPMIRYPVGDLAEWVEVQGTPKRKFLLRGRCGEGYRVRIGVFTLFPDEIGREIQRRFGACVWQMLIGGAGEPCERVTLCVVRHGQVGDTECLESALGAMYPPERGFELPIRVRWCSPGELVTHPRSGKLPRVVDLRGAAERAAAVSP
jgi:phenylacetate-CoA ligase